MASVCSLGVFGFGDGMGNDLGKFSNLKRVGFGGLEDAKVKERC